MKLAHLTLLGTTLLAVGIGPWVAAACAAPGGETLFRQRCQACHLPGRASPLGPNLTGVIGRKAGSTSFNYSPAMKRSGLIWTQANLEHYLAGPAKVVPGSKMVVSVPDPAQRKALIEHLATLK